MLYGRYHTLSVSDIIPFLVQHKFILVTDRISDPQIINHYFSDYKEDIRVETSKLEDFNKLKDLGFHPMLTIGDLRRLEFWYYIWLSLTNKYPVDWIVISATQSDFGYVRALKSLLDVHTAMYTTNEKDFFEIHLGLEADLVYTDSWVINNE